MGKYLLINDRSMEETSITKQSTTTSIGTTTENLFNKNIEKLLKRLEEVLMKEVRCNETNFDLSKIILSRVTII